MIYVTQVFESIIQTPLYHWAYGVSLLLLFLLSQYIAGLTNIKSLKNLILPILQRNISVKSGKTNIIYKSLFWVYILSILSANSDLGVSLNVKAECFMCSLLTIWFMEPFKSTLSSSLLFRKTSQILYFVKSPDVSEPARAPHSLTLNTQACFSSTSCPLTVDLQKSAAFPINFLLNNAILKGECDESCLEKILVIQHYYKLVLYVFQQEL